MKKRIRWLRILAALLLMCPPIAAAQSDLPQELIHEALLATMPPEYYPNSEHFAEGHTVLGTQLVDGTLEIYLAASVGGYGFMGGGFVEQNGWSGPCTLVIRQDDMGAWTLVEVKEIEAYSEIPRIMPAWAEEKYFAQKGRNDHGEQIREQLQIYLDSIERTEPILSYSDVGGELSGMLTTASNFRNCVDADYPLGCTTLERIEDQRRYLYTRSWEPDAEGVDGFVYTGKKGSLSVRGTTGVEKLECIRKSDGMLMETISVRVELYQLTITLTDQGGTIRYVFPYDEENWTYCKPAVTRSGQCGMDTTRIDREIAELPGMAAEMDMREAEAQPDGGAEVISRIEAGEWERFTLLRAQGRNVFRLEQRMGSEWETLWENDLLVPDAVFGWANLSYTEEEEGSIREHDRFSMHWRDTLELYAGMEGEEHEAFSLLLERDARGEWQVAWYSDHFSGVHAYLFEDRILFNAGDFSQTQTGGLAFSGIEQRNASSFVPDELRSAAEALKKRVQKRDHIDYFAGAEPLYIAPGWKLSAPVYTAPGEDSLRAAKGKASVSFSDWVTILGRAGDWIMVLYERSEGKYRTGWVDASQDERLMQVASMAQELNFPGMGKASNMRRIGLSDDPIAMDGGLCVLPKETEVYVLCDDMSAGGEGLICYVELRIDGQTVRGFVPADEIGNG